MFERILVPIDLTEKNKKAVAAARELARKGTEVTLLHVIETIEDVPFEELRSFYEPIEKRAQQAFDELTGEGFGADVNLAERIAYGNRAREIVTYAEEIDADLIILGSHAVDPERPGVTTVSYQVAVLATRSVLLVK